MTTITEDIARHIKVGDIIYAVSMPYKVIEIEHRSIMEGYMTFFKVMYISTNTVLDHCHPCLSFKTNKTFNTILKSGGNI